MRVDNDFRWNNCPLCQSSNVRKIDRADYEGKVRFSTQEIELYNHPEIWGCNQCFSGFVQNIIHESASEALYSISHSGERWSRIPFEQQKTPEVVRAMAVVFRDKSRVLDIGCNTGELLDFAKKLGCVTAGLEYSEISRKIILNKGHTAYKSFDEVQELFDVITAFDLVEHLYNVPAFLSNCHSKLNSGGKLILLTGDIGSMSARIAGAHWWYAQYPEHIVFPSKLIFEGLEDINKFKLQEWLPTYASIGYKYPIYISLLRILKKLITWKKYNGLPSFFPDHALIILTKLDSNQKFRGHSINES